MDVASGGTQPAHCKNEVFYNIEKPNKWRDLYMIIGIFELYIQLLPLYDLAMRPWMYIFSKYHQPGKLSKN